MTEGGGPEGAGAAPEVQTQPTVGRWERHRREMRTEIARAAREILVERGSGGMTVREIARRLDLAPSALYRYFEGGRADIVRALTEENLVVLEVELAGIAQGLSPRERLVAICDVYLRLAREHPAEMALVLRSIAACGSGIDAPQEAPSAPPCALRALESALRAGIEIGAIHGHDKDLGMLTQATWAVLRGLLVIDRAHEQRGAAFGDPAAQVVRIFVNGLGTEWGEVS